MKTDDPRLESSRKTILERVERYNALVLAVIKGHLAIDQAMDEFIAASVSNPQYITEDNRLMFAAKATFVYHCHTASISTTCGVYYGQ